MAKVKKHLDGMSLAGQAFQRLEEMIVSLELKPGSVISEAELAAKTGIGRTPIREALQRLALHRLVQALPRRGIVVSDINVAEHLSLLETRRVLERLVAARAAKRANADHRKELQRVASSMAQAASGGQLHIFMTLDAVFDTILSEAARNTSAAMALVPLRSLSRRFWYFYRHNGDLQQAAHHHRLVVEAIVNADEQAAVDRTDDLIDYLERFTREVLD